MLVCAVGLMAHHSYGKFYHTDQRVTLKGRVVEVAFDMDKPHVYLTIQTANSGVWKAEWTSPKTLGLQSVKPDEIKQGDLLEIDGSPAIDTTSPVVSALIEIRRPSDGWRWVRAGLKTIE